MAEYTAGELKLAKDIAAKHYVKLTSVAKENAAARLEALGLVRVYEQDGKVWAKARSREAYDTLRNLTE